jgi:hypothetical protein
MVDEMLTIKNMLKIQEFTEARHARSYSRRLAEMGNEPIAAPVSSPVSDSLGPERTVARPAQQGDAQ